MTSSALTKLSFSTQIAENHTVFIAFNGNIHITKVLVDKFELLESLNYLGSNLGLWPGLGLYQLLEGVVGFTLSLSLGKFLLNKIKCRITHE